MDYEKAYKEALERAKANYKADKEMGFLENCDMLELIFPELAESEDERMLTEFNDYLCEEIEARTNDIRDEKDRRILNMLCYVLKKVDAWLEKQKENPKNADSIPSDCVSNVKCVNRWYKVEDFLPDNGRDVLAKDALGNYLIANYDGDRWYISGYDNEDKPIVYTPAIKEWCDIPSEKQKEPLTPLAKALSNFLKNDFEFFARKEWNEAKWNEVMNTQAMELQMLAYLDEQKEQKPVVTHGETYHVDTLGTQQVIAGKMPQKPSWSEGDEKMKERLITRLNWITYNTRTDGTSPNITFFDEIEWLKSLRPQPKVEWNKQDVDMINWLIRCCEKEHEELCNDKYGHQEIISDLKRDCRRKWDWLESLKNKVVPQSSWKPSEDEERLIKTSISFLKDFADKGYENAVECIDWLKSKLNGNTCK